MPFCTLLEWDGPFDLDKYEEMNRSSGVHEVLPDGLLARIVGAVDSGARIVEVWRAPEDASDFNAKHGHLVAEFEIPPPSRVAAFDATVFQTAD